MGDLIGEVIVNEDYFVVNAPRIMVNVVSVVSVIRRVEVRGAILSAVVPNQGNSFREVYYE